MVTATQKLITKHTNTIKKQKVEGIKLEQIAEEREIIMRNVLPQVD